MDDDDKFQPEEDISEEARAVFSQAESAETVDEKERDRQILYDLMGTNYAVQTTHGPPVYVNPES